MIPLPTLGPCHNSGLPAGLENEVAQLEENCRDALQLGRLLPNQHSEVSIPFYTFASSSHSSQSSRETSNAAVIVPSQTQRPGR